jgi:hypothetical protein
VQEVEHRAFCLGCGASLAAIEAAYDEFVGGLRVRRVRPPAVCASCTGWPHAPRHCPTCGAALEPSAVSALSDETGTGWTATCPAGHTNSGHLQLSR